MGAARFQQVIFELELCELVATGQKFTWMNNREESDFVMERLDRAIAIVEWVNTYPSYALRNFPILHFDHGPIILDFEFQHPFRRRPFRFEHMWITHPICKDMVQQAWNIHTKGSRAVQGQKRSSEPEQEGFWKG